MKDKINVERLYVGNPYFIKYIMMEPFMQYESFGDTLNEVYVFTKKYLFEETKDGYLLCGTNNVYKGHYPNSSYHSHGNNGFSLYNGFNSWGSIFGLESNIFERLKREYQPSIKFGYFISFKDFIKKTLNINISGKISYKEVKILLSIANMKRIKRMIKLDEYDSKKQLDKYNLTDVTPKTKKKVKSE